MKCEDQLDEWLWKLNLYESELKRAIRVIEILRNEGNWSKDQIEEIDKKIEELQNVLIPY